jgi:hypothetical protein
MLGEESLCRADPNDHPASPVIRWGVSRNPGPYTCLLSLQVAEWEDPLERKRLTELINPLISRKCKNLTRNLVCHLFAGGGVGGPFGEEAPDRADQTHRFA